MGFISKLFQNKKLKNIPMNNHIEEESISITSTKNDNSYINFGDKTSSAVDYCEQIIESTKQLEEAKLEYQAVTSYLSDIQKIDRMPPESREQLNSVATNILTLSKERKRYQSNSIKITDVQFINIAKYEDILLTDMKKINDYEEYNNIIKKDMNHLEGEKTVLNYQKDDINEKQTYLKKISTTLVVLIISLFGFFFILYNAFQSNIQLPFLMTVLMGLISSLYILYQTNANRKDMKLIELKINRAILLLNKVKIKYINNTNALDYMYQKYNINSYQELNYLWGEYKKAKEEENLYRNNSKQLELAHEELISLLKSFQIVDPDIWVYQIVALIDNKEMVEVRHHLNIRRQKLRERIDYNNQIKEQSMKDITKALSKNPDYKEKVLETLKKYGIYL